MTPIHVVAVTRWLPEDGDLVADVLPAMQRRRASRLTRMTAHVVGGLAKQVPLDLSSIPMVFGTCYGEMHVTVELMRMMHVDDGALSPMRFSGSVHNAAGGMLSIALGNRAFTTTVTAGGLTVPMTLLEAMTVLNDGASEVLVAIAEESMPEPFSSRAPYGELAVGLLLSSRPMSQTLASRPALCRLDPPRACRPTEPKATLPAWVAHNPCASTLALLEAMQPAVPAPTSVRLDATEDRAGTAWCLDVHPISS
jgi:Beta-ketoacyl synthase, N-terminal domain